MPKMKTHKGLARRFKRTASGKIRFKPNGAGHLMTGKSGNRCRKLRRPTILDPCMTRVLRERLGKG